MNKFELNRRNFIKNSLLSAAALGLPGCASVSRYSISSHQRPNIVYILIDDLGCSDLGCYGNSYCDTPNIDHFATEGMKFTAAYTAAPICSASRAGFLTGRSPARLGFEFVTKYENDYYDWNEEWAEKWKDKELFPPPYTINLPLDEITLAEYLRSAGYITGITGKWHVAGHHNHYNGWSLTHGPQQQGFDYAIETFGSHPYSKTKEKKENSIVLINLENIHSTP